jgi:hypothetical protein
MRIERIPAGFEASRRRIHEIKHDGYRLIDAAGRSHRLTVLPIP